MNKKLWMGLVLVLVVNSLFLVSAAVDTKMKVKYCEFAVSDIDVSQWKYEDSSGTDEADVFKPWNETEQEGIFMLSNNKNLVLEEASDYEFTRYTLNRTWFNEFGSDGSESDIPVIDVGVGQDKWIYTRCFFKTGDYRIFLFDKSFYDYYYLTDDFNLTTGIIPYDTSSGTPRVSTYGNYLALLCVSSKLNNLNPGESGLFPYTEPYIIYKTKNLAKKPSSNVRFGMSWMLRELGRVNLISSPSPGAILYINNFDSDYAVENFLKVTQLGGEIVKKDEDSGETIVGGGDLKIIPGHNYSMIVPFENRYGVPLTMNFIYGIRPNGWPYSRGLGMGNVALFPHQARQTKILSFLPGETKNLTNSYVIPNNDGGYAIVHSYQYTHWSNVDDPEGYIVYSWPRVGSDEYPYLSFQTIDPRIEMIKEGGVWTAIFNITTDLYVESNTYNLDVAQDDYELEGRVYKNSIIPENLEYMENYPLPSDLNKGATPFNWRIPIDPSWQGGRYYIKLLSKMLKSLEPHPSFQDKYISVYYGNPYFKPGDIAYQYDNRLNFGLDSKIDSEKIVIFNPTFYENDVELSVERWSDEDNFILSWDGVNFEKNPTKTFHLLPLESREIIFWVNASYEFWPEESILEKLKIKASANLITEEEITLKTNYLDYILDVRNVSIGWFDLVLGYYEPEVMDVIEGGNNTKTIRYDWFESGNDESFTKNSGKEYNVTFKLINKINGLILNETKEVFIINDSKNKKYIELIYNFSVMDYQIEINLDPEFSIDELDSSGNDANNNFLIHDYQIISCKVEEGYLYYYDFLKGWVVDNNCGSGCFCPNNFMCVLGGYCSYLFGECNYDNLDDCNDFSFHLNELCGWECSPDEGSIGCPPPIDYKETGSCVNCGGIIDSCSGYNNEITCELDPCKKKIFDCDFLNCDKSKDYYCKWDSFTQKCFLNSNIGDVNCDYYFKISKCNEFDIAIGEYIDINGNPDCPNKVREISCKNILIKLGLFSFFEFLISIFILLFIYFMKNN